MRFQYQIRLILLRRKPSRIIIRIYINRSKAYIKYHEVQKDQSVILHSDLANRCRRVSVIFILFIFIFNDISREFTMTKDIYRFHAKCYHVYNTTTVLIKSKFSSY